MPLLVNSDHECTSFAFDIFDYYNIRSSFTTPTYNISKTNYGALLRYLHN